MNGVTRRFEISSAIDEIRRVQIAIQDEMRRFDFPDDDAFAVKLALEESLVNAVKHGNRYDPERKVHVCVDIDDERVKISIEDEGPGFNPECVPDPTAEENLTKPCGRGIMLMRAYMDDVYYDQGGRRVCLVKRRS